MNSRERVVRALNHQEPDRVPFDLGGTGLSTIHITAYQNLRRYLDLPPTDNRPAFLAEQLVLPEEDLAERLQTDVRPVLPGRPAGYQLAFEDQGAYEAYYDEWGIGWRKPRDGGFYYDMYHHPLAGAETLAELLAYPFPDPLDDGRFATLRAQAEAAAAAGKAVALAGPSAGIAEIYSWLRGYEQYYVDLALNPTFVGSMLDRLVEFKSAFWARLLCARSATWWTSSSRPTTWAARMPRSCRRAPTASSSNRATIDFLALSRSRRRSSSFTTPAARSGG